MNCEENCELPIFRYDRIKDSFRHDGMKSYQDFYYDLRAARYDTLMKKDSGIKFNGATIDSDEAMTPTVECEVVIDWLEGIDERLPDFVEQKYATELESVTLYDLQMIISERIDGHLLDISKEVEEFQNPADVVSVQYKTETDGDEKENIKNSNIFKCDICEAVLKTASKLKIHLRTHTGEKPFSCEECGQCFSQSGGLSSHRKLHTGEKLYQCDECGKSFMSRSKMKIHKRIHTGEKPYQCDECDKAFRVNSLLTIHKRKHTGVAEYICDICSKAYFDATSLTKHRRSHSDQPPNTKPQKFDSPGYFECDECRKVFTQKGYLLKHKKAHLGIKNYKCEHCGKAFAHPANLREHLRIHTGEKPFACDVCNKSFSKQNNLKVHKRIHTGETPYMCNICGVGKRELIQLKKHMLNMHSVEYASPACFEVTR